VATHLAVVEDTSVVEVEAVTRAAVAVEVTAEAEVIAAVVTAKFRKVAANELRTEARKGALNGALFLFSCSRSKRNNKEL